MSKEFNEYDELIGEAVVQDKPLADLQLELFLKAAQDITKANPLFLRYVKGKVKKNVTPWHVLGEREYWKYVAAAGVARFLCDEPKMAAVHYISKLVMSQAYLWTNKAKVLSEQMPGLPRHVISREVLQYPSMFFSRETAAIPAEGIETNSFLVTEVNKCPGAGPGILLMFDIFKGTDVQMALAHIPYGRTYPDDFEGIELKAVGDLLKTLAFIQTKIVELNKRKIPRQFRKAMTKAGLSDEVANEEISVVQLRSEIQSGGHSHRDGNTERLHHWWVRGHWRAQWYAKEGAHHVIWIEPQIRGDLSKPLLEKVYVANR